MKVAKQVNALEARNTNGTPVRVEVKQRKFIPQRGAQQTLYEQEVSSKFQTWGGRGG